MHEESNIDQQKELSSSNLTRAGNVRRGIYRMLQYLGYNRKSNRDNRSGDRLPGK